MPRKIVLRWLPDPQKIKDSRLLKWLGPTFKDPYLFHINRKSISQSFFIGLFCAYIPLPGQSVIAVILALLFRSNLPLAAALIWVTNPITIAPMFYLSYRLGAWMLGSKMDVSNISISWDWVLSQGNTVLLPLFTGSLSCGLVLGLIGFFTVRQLWRSKVIEKWEARARLRKERPVNPDLKP